MEAFLDAFFEIDKDRTENISSEELKHYMEENGYDEAFTQKWMIMFDQDNTGCINLEEFCSVLGLEYESVKVQYSAVETVPATVEVISSDMRHETQLAVYKILRKAHHVNGVQNLLGEHNNLDL